MPHSIQVDTTDFYDAGYIAGATGTCNGKPFSWTAYKIVNGGFEYSARPNFNHPKCSIHHKLTAGEKIAITKVCQKIEKEG